MMEDRAATVGDDPRLPRPAEPEVSGAAESFRLLRQSARTLVDHLRSCEACRWDGIAYCEDVPSLMAIVHFEAKEGSDA